MTKKKGIRSWVGIGAGVATPLAIFFVLSRSSTTTSPPVGDVVSANETNPGLLKASSTGSSLLTAGVPGVNPPSVASKSAHDSSEDVLLRRLSKIPLDPKVEAAIRAGNDSNAADLLALLRTRRAKNDFTADELLRLIGAAQDKLLRNPDMVLPLVGRALGVLEITPETRQDRLDLLGVVGGFPAAENPEINRSALSTLADQYANGGGASADGGFQVTVTAVQAYLATTRTPAPAANAALVQAMGGAVDHSVREVYQNLFSDRYPPPPRR